METICHVIEVEGAKNIRDVGGCPGEGGIPLKLGRFVRGASLSNVTQRGCETLRGLGISCIVDLRSRQEVEREPDVLGDDPGIRYLHVPMLDYVNSNIISFGENPLFPESMIPVYIGLLENDQEGFRAVFQAFAKEEGVVLFHCTAGKDRTGVTAMLLQGLAGVDRETIVENYAVSQSLLGDEVMMAPEHMDLPRYLFESNPETIRAAMDHLDENYGGIRGYLNAIGVTGEWQEEIRDKLLGTAER